MEGFFAGGQTSRQNRFENVPEHRYFNCYRAAFRKDCINLFVMFLIECFILAKKA